VLGLGVLEQLDLGGRRDERLQADGALLFGSLVLPSFFLFREEERVSRREEASAPAPRADASSPFETSGRTLSVRDEALALSWLPLDAPLAFSAAFSRALADFCAVVFNGF